MNKLTLILGGARSGKSTYAQNLAEAEASQVLYIATAQAFDEEMRERIRNHQNSRPEGWVTLEAPLGIYPAMQSLDRIPPVVLLDCLTILSSNALLPLPEPITTSAAEEAVMAEIDGVIHAFGQFGGHWIIVSNEVGLGLVPPYPLGRVYRDALGRANQKLAGLADEVIFMVSGIPMKIKGV